MDPRTILHVDLDAFFAAVEQRDRPELRGKPVIVGGGGPNQRGVVSAASYEARAFGVHSAMPLQTAGRLCPQGVFLPVDGTKYQAVSRDVMAILRRYTPLVEPISIDEAFLDVTGSQALFGDGETIGRRIRADVSAEIGLTVSVGVARTKLVAKIASDLRKPDALVVVPPGEEATFLAPLAITRLWGVGAKLAASLREYGVGTIGDLAALPDDLLTRRFGKHGASIGQRARGIDSDPVGGRDAAKSVSHEHTFDVDTSDREVIERTILGMAEGVAGRLRDSGVKAATVTVKIREFVLPHHHPAAHVAGADRSDRADLPDGRRARPTRSPRPPHQAPRRCGVRVGRARAAGAVCGGRPETPAGCRGRRRGAASVRRAGDHPGPPGWLPVARTVRARPDDGGRSAPAAKGDGR